MKIHTCNCNETIHCVHPVSKLYSILNSKYICTINTYLYYALTYLTKKVQFKAKFDSCLTFLLINFLVLYKKRNIYFADENMKKNLNRKKYCPIYQTSARVHIQDSFEFLQRWLGLISEGILSLVSLSTNGAKSLP